MVSVSISTQWENNFKKKIIFIISKIGSIWKQSMGRFRWQQTWGNFQKPPERSTGLSFKLLMKTPVWRGEAGNVISVLERDGWTPLRNAKRVHPMTWEPLWKRPISSLLPSHDMRTPLETSNQQLGFYRRAAEWWTWQKLKVLFNWPNWRGKDWEYSLTGMQFLLKALR